MTHPHGPPPDGDETVFLPPPGTPPHAPPPSPPGGRPPLGAVSVEPDAAPGAEPARRGRRAPRERRPRAPWPVRLVRGTLKLLLFLGACWALLVAAIHLFGRRDEARPSDAIVVLGAAQYDGRPSPVLQARLDHAIALYRRGVAPRMIMTGGTAPGDTVSEAEVGRRYAIRAGVPAGAILTERSGMTTLESIRAVAELMHQRGDSSAVLVSDPFHMLRLKLLARRAGLRGYSSPTRTSPISRNRAEERRFLVRESFGLPLAVLGAI
ncbi:MAG TPA: YdcF family protein [Longimicrobium sp.]|nr:YdcF family protein [Longimicrobium sp.]